MPKFIARTIDAKGVTNEEVVEAPNENVLNEQFKERGLTLVSASDGEKSKKRGFNMEISFGSGVSTQDKIMFSRNLGAMIEAGLSVSRALSVIEKQTKKKKFKSIITELNKSISQGTTFSESMAKYGTIFPSIMISMVKAGEESGSLAQSLRLVANQMENSYNLTRKIRGALMYPMVILIAMTGIGVFMLAYVVPILSATFISFGTTLPIQTQIIIDASNFLKHNFILVTLVVALIIVGGYFGLRTKKGKRLLDFLFLHLPIIGGMTKEINSARTARTLSSLLSSGVNIVVAMRITRDVLQNSYYKEVLELVEERIQKGEPVAKIFSERENLYPVFVGEMISVGEETGQLAQMLLGVAVFYENDIDQKTKDMSSVIEPVLMIFIGLAVGFFAVSIISPIYSLSSAIS
jgi:type IV pilus assembly protein PilC